MNALEKVVDLLAAVMLLFIVPLLFYGGGMRASQAVLAGRAGENFLKRVCTMGEITLPVWEELEDALERYQCDGYSIQRKRSLYEPVEGNTEVTERIYIADKESLEEQVKKNGNCKLCKGDRITVTIYVNDIPTAYSALVRTGAEHS